MANKKITDLTELTAAATDDYLEIVDTSANTSKKISYGNLIDANAGTWQSYTPTWTASTTNPSIGNGTLSGRYFQIGKLVYCQFTMRAGSTTTFGSGLWRFSYPVAPVGTSANLYQVGSVHAADSGTANYNGITQYAGATYMSLIINNNWVSATAPFTWANGDYLEVNTIYEAA